MQFENYFALMQDDQVTVLRPEKAALSGRYDHTRSRLVLAGEAAGAETATALAHSLLPSWLYRQQRYKLADQTGGTDKGYSTTTMP
jgi:hypothetical protein